MNTVIKKSNKKKPEGLVFRGEVKETFIKLKIAFLKENLILIYFDPEKDIKVKINALLFAVIDILL